MKKSRGRRTVGEGAEQPQRISTAGEGRGNGREAFPVEPRAAEPRAPAPTSRGRIAELKSELGETRAYLQSIIEDHQRTSEALLSANEELATSNEELQTLNEELQTAKEELETTNQELSTANEQLQAGNSELASVNSDLVNILGSVDVAIVIVDANRRIRRFTPQAGPLLSLLPSDVGRPLDDINPTLVIEDLDRKIAGVIDAVAHHEEEVQARDGRWYRLQVRPYTTVDKRVDGAILSVIDIDVLKRASAAAEWGRDYARAIVEAVQTPLLVLDDTFTISSANEAFEERFGLSLPAIETRRLQEIMNRAWDLDELRAALSGIVERNVRFQNLELECEVPRLGRRTLSFSGRSVPTPGQGRPILLAVEDITERQRGQVERERMLRETEAAKASAEEANRSKDLFLATLSHELRTPLTSLILHAQLIRRGKMDGAALQKAAESIERASKAQAQLIEDLLDISRIVTGKLKMEMQEVGLAAVVRAAIETVRPIAMEKQITLDVGLDESLELASGDSMRLQQAVWNLLTNAIKFTPVRGRVRVTLDAAGGWGRIRVSDTGIGIEPAFLPVIFKRFSQEDRGDTRSHGGLGLGLPIMRYVVESHGGSVQAESAGKGQGSTFTILLPIIDRQAVAASRSRRSIAEGETTEVKIEEMRVLVVEDDGATRDAMTEMLRLTGADVRAADSAAAAMMIFERWRPELLVCDIAMPTEDGCSLLGRIRALGPGRGGDIPAVALTALAGEDDRRRVLEAGFQAHMPKPVDIDQLVATLTGLLRPTPEPSQERSPPSQQLD
jgi:two-component system CheB/CheR fusion protein